MESNRELAGARLRHSEGVRRELEEARGRLRSAEEEAARKQATVSHNNHQARREQLLRVQINSHGLLCREVAAWCQPRHALPRCESMWAVRAGGACCSLPCMMHASDRPVSVPPSFLHCTDK